MNSRKDNLFRCLPKCLGIAHENMSSGGYWSADENKLLINELELLAAYHELQIYCKSMFDTSVHLKVNNTTAIAWINKQTAPIELQLSIVKQMQHICSTEKVRNLCFLY